MKVIINITDRQLQKVAILSGLTDSEVDKVTVAAAKYSEIDITGTIAGVNEAIMAIAAFAVAALANLEGN